MSACSRLLEEYAVLVVQSSLAHAAPPAGCLAAWPPGCLAVLRARAPMPRKFPQGPKGVTGGAGRTCWPDAVRNAAAPKQAV